MKMFITSQSCEVSGLDHAIDQEGTLVSYRRFTNSNGVDKDTICIMMSGYLFDNHDRKINKKQAFALFALVYALNTKTKAFEIPEISGDFTSWDEITELAK